MDMSTLDLCWPSSWKVGSPRDSGSKGWYENRVGGSRRERGPKAVPAKGRLLILAQSRRIVAAARLMADLRMIEAAGLRVEAQTR